MYKLGQTASPRTSPSALVLAVIGGIAGAVAGGMHPSGRGLKGLAGSAATWGAVGAALGLAYGLLRDNPEPEAT